MPDQQPADVPCAAGCGWPAKPAGSRGFRSSLCEECARYKVQEQTRERVRRHRARIAQRRLKGRPR